jgi:hypothetical protein
LEILTIALTFDQNNVMQADFAKPVYNNIEGELLPSGISPPSEKAISQILSGFELPVSDLFG